MAAQRTVIWQSDDATLPAVEEALRRAAMQPAEQDAGAPLPRARALTLVMLADGEDERRADAVARLALRHPLRAILVARLPEAQGPALSARIRRHLHPAQGSSAIAEEVELHVRGGLGDHLAQLLAPLLLPELPTIFWWVGAPPLRAPAFAEVRELCDRGVVDLREAPELAAVATPETLDVLTWRRQAPWREQVASLFDPPAHRGAVRQVARVEIVHGREGHLAACLLGGWIGSRLNLGPEAVELRPVAGAGPHGVAEAVLTASGGGSYRVHATADGEHATLQRPGEKPQRVRLGELRVGEALDLVLAGQPDPLWPAAWRLASAIAAAGHGRHGRGGSRRAGA